MGASSDPNQPSFKELENFMEEDQLLKEGKMAKESKESLEERAKSSASLEELEKLAEDADAEVRGAVADNPNTPASLLEKLAADEYE